MILYFSILSKMSSSDSKCVKMSEYIEKLKIKHDVMVAFCDISRNNSVCAEAAKYSMLLDRIKKKFRLNNCK